MDKDTLLTRQYRILKIVVNSYIDTALPVGSKSICQNYSPGLSPATIRNIMSDLEEEGYLMHPHTSAGRVPTDKGYRLYVDALMDREQVNDREKEAVEQGARANAFDEVFEKVSRALSYLTGQASVMVTPNRKLFFEGTSNILAQPEFRDINRLRAVIKAFDEKFEILNLLEEDIAHNIDISVHIGSENNYEDLRDCSIIASCYKVNGKIAGALGVLGPTRLNYSRAVSLVDFISDYLSQRLDDING